MVFQSRNDPTISLAPSGNFALKFSSESPTVASAGHSVEIPVGDNGLRLIRKILTARQAGNMKLGQDGNPTQEMIKAWLANKYEQDALTLREAEELAKQEEEEANARADAAVMNDF